MGKETFIKIFNWVIPGLTFILGLLVKHYYELFKNKIPKLQYEINKSFLGASGDKVQVLYDNLPVLNLYLCNIYLVNTSNTDFANLEITLWCDIDSIILVSNGQRSNTIKPLEFTSKYQQEFLDPNNPNSNVVWSRRDYSIPVLNRDDSVTFSCLVTNSKGNEPSIFLDCQHIGLKLEPNFVKPKLMWGERQDISALWGLIISGLLVIPFIYFIKSKIIVSIIVFLLGAFCIIPGVLFLKLCKKIKKLTR